MNAGLCKKCIHAKIVRNQRSGLFFLCEYSKLDSSFVKYPKTPVISCRAFENKVSKKTFP